VVGSASVVNLLLGLLRQKVAAAVLGPAGIGMIGLLQNLVGVAAFVAAVGLGNVGTRHVAEAAAREEPDALAVARRALFWWTGALALAGSFAFLLLSPVFAKHVLNDPNAAGTIAVLSLAVAFTVISGSQGALLIGLRRVGDFARSNVLAAVLSSAAVIAAVLLIRDGAIPLFVIAPPLATCLVAGYFTWRLPRVGAGGEAKRTFAAGRAMLALGFAVMIGNLAGTGGELIVRSIARDQGAVALGLFQASWATSVLYVGIVLQAMTADYYPRISAAVEDSDAARQILNDQTEIALLAVAPILLIVLGWAPLVLSLLFSSEFTGAAWILRWMCLGNLFKVASWPLAYLVLAKGVGRIYLVAEIFGMVVFTGAAFLLVPRFGIEGTGLAFLAAYALYLPLVYIVALRATGVRWSGGTKLIFALVLAAITIGLLAVASGEVAAAIVCSVLAVPLAVLAWFSFRGAGIGPMVRAKAARWAEGRQTRR
jgi:PST family polysaccharide transporter